VTVPVAFGAVGAHAGNAAPEANVATDGAGLWLGLAVGELAGSDGFEAGAVGSPGPVDDEGDWLEVHADSATRTATSIAAADICLDVLPDSTIRAEPEGLIGPSMRRGRQPTVLPVSRPSVSAEVAPAPDPLDGDTDHRPILEAVALVLRIFPAQGSHRRRVFMGNGSVIRLDQLGDPLQTEPAKPAPVLRPAIDQQLDHRALEDVADALEIVGIDDALRLLVEWRVQQQARRLRHNEANWHETREPAAVDRRQHRGSSRNQKGQFDGAEKRLGRHRPMMNPRVAAGRTVLPGMLVLAMAVAVLTACGESVNPAPSHDLAEPWQAVPFDLDAATLAAAIDGCRPYANSQVLPPLAMFDARGANTVIVAFAQGGNTANCTVVGDEAGRFSTTTAIARFPSGEPLLGSRELRPRDNGPTVAGVGEATYLLGIAGLEIAAVEIVIPSGKRVKASLANGWFAAWWPGRPKTQSDPTINGYDASGNLAASKICGDIDCRR
jgi:hypothetical protein